MRERVDGVCLNWDEDAHHSEAEGNEADNGDDPLDDVSCLFLQKLADTYMYCVIGRPSIPEERDGHEAGEEDTGRESHLGFKDSAVGFGHSNNGAVRDLCDKGKTTEESYS